MTDDRPAGILGGLGEAGGRGVVRMEDRFDTDVVDLWSALTEPPRLARWLGQVEGDLRLGGEFRALFFASGWEGTGRVEACEPPRRLLLTTKGTDADEQHTIEVTLSADAGQTLLVLESRGMPPDQVAGYGAGLQIHVEDLGAYLDGRERCDARSRFEELFPSYQGLAAGK